MTTSIDTGRKTRPWAVAVYLGFVFVLILSWMVIQPLNASPDELMRYDIVEYLVEHGTLPDGRDPEIRHELWGISYAFNPILAYMIMAIPAKFASLFTASSTAVLLAARLVNAVFGTIMAYLTLRIGEMLFRGRAKWMFASLVTFLPGLVFVHSYVNNDSMALLSVTWIVYTWIRSMKMVGENLCTSCLRHISLRFVILQCVWVCTLQYIVFCNYRVTFQRYKDGYKIFTVQGGADHRHCSCSDWMVVCPQCHYL